MRTRRLIEYLRRGRKHGGENRKEGEKGVHRIEKGVAKQMEELSEDMSVIL